MSDTGGHAKVLAAISHAETLDLLKELVRIPSPSAAEENASAFLERYLLSAGFSGIRRDARANMLFSLQGARPGPSRAFVSHFDSGGVGTMVDAYDPQVLPGDRFGKPGPVIRGLGASAPKSAIAAMVGAARALARCGNPFAGVIHIGIVTKDMHANHAGPRELLESFPFEVESLVASEPSGNRLVLGARGINHYRVELAGRAAHNGRPKDAANPLYALADVLRSVETMELPSHPALGVATISAFAAGSEAAPPMSPHRAHALLDRRTLPSETTTGVEAELRARVAAAIGGRAGISAQISLVRAMHSFETPAASPLVRRLQAAVNAALGHELETMYIAFASNAGFAITDRGWQAVGFGPGSITDLGPEEHVEIAQVEEATRIYVAMMAGA